MFIRSLLSICIVFPLFHLLGGVPDATCQSMPTVVSTLPFDMAVDVSPTLASYSITFSEPMDTRYGIASTNGWPAASLTWSADKMTVTLTRLDLPTPLQAGFTYMIYLNHPASPNQEIKFRDTEGNFLDFYVFSFTVAGGHAGLRKISADPSKGFSWPYFLYIPPNIKDPATILVQPNNTGTVNDDPAVHEQSARDLIESTKGWADQLGTPYLIPTFPRPATLAVGYTHALDRDALLTKVSGYERIDLQLMAMISDARSLLGDFDIAVDSRIFMMGVSASGSFVSRFTMLHPEIVKAASIGAPGFGPIVPVPTWNSQNLPYPEGISDLESLVGTVFNSAMFQTVSLQLYVGDEDANVDPWWNTSDPTVARVIAAFGGRHLYTRWPRYEAAYHSVTSLAQFVVFPEMGHAWAAWSYIQEFFENNRLSPHAPLAKPFQYKIYFPQIASFYPWQTGIVAPQRHRPQRSRAADFSPAETIIALVNTIPGGVNIKGELQAFSATGGDPMESLSIEIPPGGHKEVMVETSYRNPADIAYIAFRSDSGFIAGYTRFKQPGDSVSLAAKSATTEGWFPRMELNGYTGLALVNVSSSNATVTLTAYDENGGMVERQVLVVPAQNRVTALTSQLFHGDISNARYFAFTSDKKVVAFTVNGSRDGEKVDGLPALDRYTR